MQKNMFRKGLVLAVIVLCFGASIISSTGKLDESNKATIGRDILYVGGSGPGNYSSIQAAIDDANSGDTVFVYCGTYEEQISANKSIALEGENNTNTVVVGGFNVSEYNTTIKYFNITGGYEWDLDGDGMNGTNRAGIFASSSNNKFFNNYFWNITGGKGETYGFYAGNGGIGTGIYLQSSNSSNITLNSFSNIHGGLGGGDGDIAYGGTGGVGAGICLEFSNNNNITFNTISNIYGGNGSWANGVAGRGGVGAGIYLWSSCSNSITLTTISSIYGGVGGVAASCSRQLSLFLQQ